MTVLSLKGSSVELYIQFLETHQNNREKASDYLRHLQALLQEILERDGVTKQDAESQLLKQLLRGCWDDSLITALPLKELLSNPFKRAEEIVRET